MRVAAGALAKRSRQLGQVGRVMGRPFRWTPRTRVYGVTNRGPCGGDPLARRPCRDTGRLPCGAQRQRAPRVPPRDSGTCLGSGAGRPPQPSLMRSARRREPSLRARALAYGAIVAGALRPAVSPGQAARGVLTHSAARAMPLRARARLAAHHWTAPSVSAPPTSAAWTASTRPPTFQTQYAATGKARLTASPRNHRWPWRAPLP